MGETPTDPPPLRGACGKHTMKIENAKVGYTFYSVFNFKDVDLWRRPPQTPLCCVEPLISQS